jgi:hypothetical protein
MSERTELKKCESLFTAHYLTLHAGTYTDNAMCGYAAKRH